MSRDLPSRATDSVGARPLCILAYDHTGNVRVAHEVEAGDIVEWKRNGTRGAFKCEVKSAWRSPGGSTMLSVEIIAHDGVPACPGQVRKITGRQILGVYRPDGQRKEPVRQ